MPRRELLKKGNFERKFNSLQSKELSRKRVVSLDEVRAWQSAPKYHHILVVSHDSVLRNALKRILERESAYKLYVAEDALGLLQFLDSLALGLVLLDLHLPWVDGLELCRLLKAHDFSAALPVMIISGAYSSQELELSLAAGAAGYVAEPFEAQLFRDKVQSILS